MGNNPLLFYKETGQEVELDSVTEEQMEELKSIWQKKCCEAIGYRIVGIKNNSKRGCCETIENKKI